MSSKFYGVQDLHLRFESMKALGEWRKHLLRVRDRRVAVLAAATPVALAGLAACRPRA